MGKHRKFVSHGKISVRNKDGIKSIKETISNVDNKPTNKEEDYLESGFKVVQINLIDLPSKFMPYPKGSVIKYRPYYYEEIKNHDQSKNLTYREEVNFVLSGVCTTFNKYDLTLSDYLYINLLRRISNTNSGDYDIVVRYQCKGCGNVSKNIFKASEIMIDYLEVPDLPVTVEFSSGKKYSFKPLTIGHYIELVEEGFKNKSVSSIAKCCINAPYDEIYDFIASLTDVGDIALANYIDMQLYHSLKPMILRCQYKEIEYIEKDGYTIDKLREMRKNESEKNQLLELFNKYDIKFVEETDMFDLAFRDLVKKMALIKEIPCNHVNSVELDGGDIFIGPFCEYKQLMEARICYG